MNEYDEAIEEAMISKDEEIYEFFDEFKKENESLFEVLKEHEKELVRKGFLFGYLKGERNAFEETKEFIEKINNTSC